MRAPPRFQLWACLALMAAAGAARGAQPAPASAAYEYDVKAAFLYHFTWYLQWPKASEAEVFTIVVLGKSGIVAPLEEIARKKTVGSARIVVRQCYEIGQIGHPRILFIARSAASELVRALEKTRGTDILTISEVEGFGRRGVAINFVERRGAIKFEMNEGQLRKSGIQAGSQLMRLAILVNAEK